MDGMNLNGRIVGRTSDGQLLIKISVAEYLNTLPMAAIGGPIVPEPATAALPVKPTVAVRRLTAPRKAAATHAERECKYCGFPFKARTGRQVTCGKEACQKKHQAFLADEWRKNQGQPKAEKEKVSRKAIVGLAKEMIKPVAKLTPEQKQKRLELIRSKLRDIDAKHGSSRLIQSEVPSELAQAEREASTNGEG